MYRQLRFRGKRNGGSWHYGETISCSNLTNKNTATLSGQGFCCVVDKDTIGQFTEYYDDNKLEMYEDDILKITYNDGTSRLFKIIFADGAWRVSNFSMTLLPVMLELYERAEVVGNIHDNPDLAYEGQHKKHKSDDYPSFQLGGEV